MTILFLAHPEQDGSLSELALQTLTSTKRIAEALATDFTVGLIGGDLQKAADTLATCGSTKFLAVEGEDFNSSRYATDVPAITALIKESAADLVFAPASIRFKRALPGAAFRVGGSVDSQVTALNVKDGSLEIERWYYRQRIKGTLSRSSKPWCLLIDSGCDTEWSGESGQAVVQKLTVTINDLKTKVIGVEDPSGDARTIRPEAKLLFVAGAGWTKKQNDPANDTKKASEFILDFLDKTKASLGSSKSLVDQSEEGAAVLPFLSHLNQIGQTGSTPHHQKGLATCCHGEEPHVVGWRFINERRAINTNESCSWAHGKTDVLYVADAFKVIEELNKIL
ncbi:MAG: electron transfer flavoprotein subunit alpha/FixB family protein [Bdellovibrionota bacterium]|jgi:electron transfer flavoprotein alpha subunit